MNRLLVTFTLICLTISFIEIDAHRHHGGRHHYSGTYNAACSDAARFLNQWFSQSTLSSTFRSVCCQIGVTQSWTILQQLLGVPVTGTLDQATFQALLNTADPNNLAQQFLNNSGVAANISGK